MKSRTRLAPSASKSPCSIIIFATGLGLSALCAPLFAGTTWDGTGSNTNINTQENWNDDLNPILTGGGSILTFGTGGSTAVINTDVNISGIVFNRNANFEIANGAGSLTLGTGGISMTLPNTTGRTHTISESNLILSGNQTWSVTNNTGTARLNVSSVIDDGASTFGIVKAGTGLLVLSNSNTFGGSVSFSDNSSGQIRVTNSGAFGTGPKTVSATVGSGARIELDGTAGNLTFASNIQFSLSGSVLRNIAGDNIINGVTGAALGAGAGIVESNGGTLTLAGTVRAVNSGGRTLTIQGSSTGANTISGQIIDGTSAFSLNKQGTGTWIINSTSNTNNYTGTTTVGQGVLNIRSSNALGSTSAGTSVSTGAVLEIQGGITTAAEALSLNGTGVSNGGALRNISGNNIYSGAITVATAARINSDADKLTLDVASGNAVSATDLGVTFGGAGDIDVKDAIALGSAGVTKDGAGILTYNATNTYTGTTTVNAGRLVINANQSTNGDVVINDTGTIKMSSTRTFKSGTNIAVNAGGTWLLDGSSQTVAQLTGGGTIDMAYATSGTDTLTVGSGDVSSTFDGVIREEAIVTSRVIALTKTGSGTLTLTGANTHGGTTSVSGGVLRISNASALGDTTAGTSIAGGTATSRLELTGVAVSFAAESVNLDGRSSDAAHLSNLSGNNIWNGNITTGTGGNVYTIESQADKLTIAGGISVNQSGSRTLNLSGAGDGEVTGIISGSESNTAALTKLGAGTWTLSNATNSYSGATTVTQGMLLINGNISTSTTTVKDTATLGGNGTTGAVFVENGGKLAPGNSIDSLTASGNVNLESGSIFEVEIDTASSYDTLGLNLGGDLNITGGAKLSLLNFGSANLIALNSRLQLIDYSSVGSTWNGGLFTLGTEELSDGETFVWASQNWLINYDDTLGAGDTTLSNSGNYVTLTVIPEPCAALLGGMGILILLRRRR